METSQVAAELKSNLQSGLTKEQAKTYLEKYGPNVISEEAPPNPFMIFISQFLDPIVLILIAALLVSAFLAVYSKATGKGEAFGGWEDALAIGVILLLNAILGFIQEYRAERALAALKKLSAPRCRVMRNGEIVEIDTETLVPGDLLLLTAGDKIPADGRFIDAKHIMIDEASLTGESVPVDKQTAPLKHETRLVGEKRNMAFLGTSVVKGRGTFIVTATGRQTELGKVAESLVRKSDDTPLQKDLKKLGAKILVISLAACAVVFAIGIFHQVFWLETLLVAISLAVAAIPEGLPAAVTISLALGVRRMADKRAIARRLHAVETLGSTTYICSDKTGTLTENKMQVERLIPIDREKEPVLLKAMLLCNDTAKSADGLVGDPTETALVAYAEQQNMNLETIRKQHSRLDEIAFDSNRKMMTTVNKWNGGYVSLTKGAPEKIIIRCVNLTDTERKQWLDKCTKLSEEGYRLLGFATKKATSPNAEEAMEQDMQFLGIVAESDPPRPEVPQAIRECRKAGIKVAMITGDHLATARAIASRIGLEGEAISGEELANMPDEILYDRIDRITVFARVSPLQKVKILEALKYRNHVVAMTGDGVNDAPALKRADIGIAMGITGTDVAVEASKMVLTDDNFATIVSAIREGRLIFSNIKKFVHFLLSCNVSEVLTVLLASIFGLPFPLFPIQILWVNLITDGLPALALGVDKPNKGLMDSPPRSVKEGIINQIGLVGIVLQGILLTVGVLGAYLVELYLLPKISGTASDLGIARTVAFCTLVFSQLLHAYNFRVGKHFLLSSETFRNIFLNLAVLFSLILQAGVLYFSPLATFFRTSPLGLTHLIVIAIASITPVIIINLLRNNRRSQMFA